MRLVACLFMALTFAFTANASNIYHVSHIRDGDTFIANDTPIRIWGVQAPEKGEGGYQEATDFLSQLILGKDLECVQKQIEKSHDRTVMQCFLDDGEDIATSLLTSGHAVEWPYFSKYYYARAFIAPSQGITGQGLLEKCQSKDNTCEGYINGVLAAQNFYTAEETGKPLFCPATWLDPQQVKDHFVNYARDHPKKQNRNAYALLIAALQDAYPCH